MNSKTPRQINAERKKANLPPLNFALFRKVIKRIETKPETYAQQTWHANVNDFNTNAREYNDGKPRPRPPCGAVACIAGETIICNAPSVKLGLVALTNADGYSFTAGNLLGLSGRERNLFDGNALTWIEPFRSQFQSAKTYKGEARAAINYLKHIIKTGKVLR